MDFVASLAELQAGASCPVCLDFTDPVTIECGHNFCRSCIHQRWEGLQDIFPCPVCLHHCPDRDFKRNTQLCHITDIVKQIPTTGSQRKLQEEQPLCEQHKEDLILFCEKDLELLCPQCNVGSDHPDRPLKPFAEAAASHRRKLKSYIERLMMDVEDAELGYEKQVAILLKAKRKIENWRKEFHDESNEHKYSLEVEYNEINASQLTEEKDIKEKLTENGRQISNHMFTLKNLLSEIAEKYLQTDLDLLTGIESIHNRYENLETPSVFSYELKRASLTLPPHYFGLHKMMSTFQVDLTLDPETAHPSLIVSTDRKSVTYRTADGLHDPQALTPYPAVLSSEGFDSGRHFWQVEILGSGECLLGVCKESFSQNTLIAPSPSNGCWQHQLCTSTYGPLDIGLLQIGIFLDYELGEVSFYNLKNSSNLCRFTAQFTEKMVPYFCCVNSSRSLQICIMRDK
ncbi:LOW QUALITY PROTEIN: tripartite motif-containing protein 60-like [Molossus nigricans]